MRERYFSEPIEIIKKCTKIDFTKDVVAGGVPVFSDKDGVYCECSDANVLIAGSTGSGKTQSIILPSMLSIAKAKESMVVNVTKTEVIDISGEFLENNGYKIYVLNFRDPNFGNAYDLLGYAKELYKKNDSSVVAELYTMGDSIFNTVRSEKDAFWHIAAINMFVGLSMCSFALYDIDKVDLGTIYSLFLSSYEKVGGTNALKYYIDMHDEIPGLARDILIPILSCPNETFQSICGVFSAAFVRYVSNNALVDMLSHSDFTVEDMQNNPVCLYIINKDETDSFKPLIASVIDSLYSSLTDYAEEVGGCLKRRVNFVLEEFSSLKISAMHNKISVSRGRNIRFLLCVQNYNQMEIIYGEDAKTIMGCCNMWIYLWSPEVAMNELFAQRISKKKNSITGAEEYIVSPYNLQYDIENKGDAIIIMERMRPFKTHLFCVSEYEKYFGLNISHDEYILFKREIKPSFKVAVKEEVEAHIIKKMGKIFEERNINPSELFSFTKAVKSDEDRSDAGIKMSEVKARIDAERERLEKEMELEEESNDEKNSCDSHED